MATPVIVIVIPPSIALHSVTVHREHNADVWLLNTNTYIINRKLMLLKGSYKVVKLFHSFLEYPAITVALNSPYSVLSLGTLHCGH